MQFRLTIKVRTKNEDGWGLLVPTGISTPNQKLLNFDMPGSQFSLVGETTTGQCAAYVSAPKSEEITIQYDFGHGGLPYPKLIFDQYPNRYTKPADELAAAGKQFEGETTIETLQVIANEVAQKFIYGHPEVRFNDGKDEIPYLSCGLTEGSCVDINLYLMAMFRSAGVKTGYVTGYFFPEEKKGVCVDSHCWVLTKLDGQIHEWDIAHHLKMGKNEIYPGLNPKPGMRLAIAHSLGLDFPMLNIKELKLIDEPLWVNTSGKIKNADIKICVQEIPS